MSERPETASNLPPTEPQSLILSRELTPKELEEYRRDFAGHQVQPESLATPKPGSIPLKRAMDWSK